MLIPMRTIRTFFLLLFCCVLFACAHRPDAPDEQQQRINTLAHELGLMAPAAPQQDAKKLATVAVTTAAQLREQYGVILALWQHNVEVNSGTKPRGLCFHYVHDLYDALQPQVAPYWQVQFVQAKPKEMLEHNAIVITASGKPWDTGIVLDGWRNAGVLYYGPVTTDKYPWQPKRKKSTH